MWFVSEITDAPTCFFNTGQEQGFPCPQNVAWCVYFIGQYTATQKVKSIIEQKNKGEDDLIRITHSRKHATIYIDILHTLGVLLILC